MSERFTDLKKIPDQPALRLLAANNAKLETQLDAPASASVGQVLAELETAGSWVDMVRLISVALPARECVWWSCLAGRDLAGDEGTPCLTTSEAWVFEPNDANRMAVKSALDTVDPDDDTALCATAALYAPGSLGPGDMDDHAAPPGAVAASAFGMNMMTLSSSDDPIQRLKLLIERGLDISKGGNGTVEMPPATEYAPIEDDEEEDT